MGKWKLLLQRYVEEMTTIEVEADNLQAALEKVDANQARYFWSDDQEWRPGDDIKDERVYGAFDPIGEYREIDGFGEEFYMELVTCKVCRWVSMGITRAQAQAEIDRFNAYFDSLHPQKQLDYYNGRRSSLDNYRCLSCGGSSFRKYDASRDPDVTGSTINPVIYEE